VFSPVGELKVMEDKTHILLNNLLYSCVSEKYRGNEQFVKEHALGYLISGESHFFTPEGTKIARAGSIGLVRRNQLIKSVKMPPAGGGEFRSINIHLSQEFLRKYSVDNRIEPVGRYTGQYTIALPPDPFLIGYFNSLLPYFSQNLLQPSETMAEIKTKEAVELLLRMDPSLKYFLFDFSEPHKIDLEAFMNRNYMYNVSADQFAKLTGRSLASFKRDFLKIFNTSPGQWLQKKRLSEAHFLITNQGRKPSEVYLDVGFENLSHFSYAFKKEYGVAPSMA
jgi:AraC family transcriptional regulator, exoenzyme S synthesis regulatory protein ExsA